MSQVEKIELTAWTLAPIRPDDPSLQGASLLIVADCVSIVYPELYKNLWIQKRTALSACPETEDPKQITEKITQIVQKSKIKDINILTMPRPCCFLLHYAVDEALANFKEPLTHLVAVEGETRELSKKAVKSRIFVKFPVKDPRLYMPRPWSRTLTLTE